MTNLYTIQQRILYILPYFCHTIREYDFSKMIRISCHEHLHSNRENNKNLNNFLAGSELQVMRHFILKHPQNLYLNS